MAKWNVALSAPHPFIKQFFDKLGCNTYVWREQLGQEIPDLLVFCDAQGQLNPCLVGEKVNATVLNRHYNPRRDWREHRMFLSAGNMTPRFGFGRGALSLNVFNGGDFIQEVDGHEAEHDIRFNKTKDHVISKCPSKHTQLMIPSDIYENTVLASSNTTKKRTYHKATSHIVHNEWHDPEVIWYPQSSSLCWQPNVFTMESYPLKSVLLGLLDTLVTTGDLK